jgi:predicted DsbA family dithiol-disulfide isomerase
MVAGYVAAQRVNVAVAGILTLCPVRICRCFVGKRRLEKAITAVKSKGLAFQIRWRPFFLDPTLPKVSARPASEPVTASG